MCCLFLSLSHLFLFLVSCAVPWLRGGGVHLPARGPLTPPGAHAWGAGCCAGRGGMWGPLARRMGCTGSTGTAPPSSTRCVVEQQGPAPQPARQPGRQPARQHGSISQGCPTPSSPHPIGAGSPCIPVCARQHGPRGHSAGAGPRPRRTHPPTPPSTATLTAAGPPHRRHHAAPCDLHLHGGGPWGGGGWGSCGGPPSAWEVGWALGRGSDVALMWR